MFITIAIGSMLAGASYDNHSFFSVSFIDSTTSYFRGSFLLLFLALFCVFNFRVVGLDYFFDLRKFLLLYFYRRTSCHNNGLDCWQVFHP